MLYRIEAGPRQGLGDSQGRSTAQDIESSLGLHVDAVRQLKVFTADGLDKAQAERLVTEAISHDPILQEASLSVLGYGVPQEIATWGNIINVITNAGVIRYDWLGYWWMWLPCAVMLILFVLAINFIGDGLRDASDPTQIG